MCCQSITHLDCHETYADEEASEGKYAERRALDVEHDGVTAIQAVSAQDVTKIQCGKGVCAGCYKNAVREGRLRRMLQKCSAGRVSVQDVTKMRCGKAGARTSP